MPHWYDQADALIADPEVDAVYIATPPAQHAMYTEAAARAGKPVYVEKPMARTFAECTRMIDVCREQGVPLFVAYYRRALPRFLKVKELLESGVVGTIRSVTTRHFGRLQPRGADREVPWRHTKEQAGGGLFFDVGSHTLDLLDYLLGPIVQVSGHASNQSGVYEVEDTVTASYVFDCGAHGTGAWCFAAAEHEEWNEIAGTEGTIKFSTFAEVPITLTRNGSRETFDIPHPPHIQQPLIQTIVNELRGQGTCPSTGESAARTNWVMEQLVAGYYGG